jgi:hypothetical protein
MDEARRDRIIYLILKAQFSKMTESRSIATDAVLASQHIRIAQNMVDEIYMMMKPALGVESPSQEELWEALRELSKEPQRKYF